MRSSFGLTPDPPDRWWTRALCGPGGEHDPDWWTVVGGHMTPGNHVARRICRSCPVRRECWEDNFATARGQIIAGYWINEAGAVGRAPGRTAASEAA